MVREALMLIYVSAILAIPTAAIVSVIVNEMTATEDEENKS